MAGFPSAGGRRPVSSVGIELSVSCDDVVWFGYHVASRESRLKFGKRLRSIAPGVFSSETVGSSSKTNRMTGTFSEGSAAAGRSAAGPANAATASASDAASAWTLPHMLRA